MTSQPGNQIATIVETAIWYCTRAARMAMFIVALSFTLVLTLGAATAVAQDVSTASEALNFDSPVKRALYHKLTHEFRCLKCQNQNLAGSAAGLADDLKNQIYTMVQRGDSSAQITEYMVARYGDFVLYKPAFKPLTLLLWVAPFILLAAGLAFVYRLSRSTRNNEAETKPVHLSDAEAMQRARELLDAD